MNKTLNFKITGLHCQSCKTLIEEDIKNLPGIIKIEVDYASGKTNLDYDDEKIFVAEIFKTISKLNYQPQFCEKENSQQKKRLHF